jgi:hypothetical protein
MVLQDSLPLYIVLKLDFKSLVTKKDLKLEVNSTLHVKFLVKKNLMKPFVIIKNNLKNIPFN